MMASTSLLEARLRICYGEVLCYDKLYIVKLLLLFKDTVDLQGPIFLDFFSFSCQTKHCYLNYSIPIPEPKRAGREWDPVATYTRLG